MAEQEQEPKPILPKDSDGEEEEESEGMQTVDLGRKPVLSFQQSPDRPVRTTVGQPPRQNGSQHASGATNGEHQAMGGTQLQQRSRVLGGNAASFKEWGSQQYKVTKQILSERFGKGLRTVDPDLERRIATIYDTQRKYNQLTALSGQLQSHLSAVIETQKSLAEHFAFLSVRAPELNLEFESNAELQKKISHNGEALLGAVKFFISNVHTVTAKSIEDTLTTAKNYETARILYDAYRTDYDSVTKAANTSQSAAARLPAVKEELEKRRQKYEGLRHDLDVKLKLLDENRIQVMSRQLILLHKAFSAYFSGSHTAVSKLVTEFTEKLEMRRSRDPPSWLENLS